MSRLSNLELDELQQLLDEGSRPDKDDVESLIQEVRLLRGRTGEESRLRQEVQIRADRVQELGRHIQRSRNAKESLRLSQEMKDEAHRMREAATRLKALRLKATNL